MTGSPRSVYNGKNHWLAADEARTGLLGVGPYRIVEWTYGQRLTLEPNPHYFQGPPVTSHIVIRFLEHAALMRALLAGEVDVVDVESLGPDDIETYQLAQAAGAVRLIARPAPFWEHLEFALTEP